MSTLVPGNSTKVTYGSPGGIWWAPLGSTIPSMVAASSTYAGDTLDAAWKPIGYTDSGFTRTVSTEVEEVTVEEETNALARVITSQNTTVSFTAAQTSFDVLRLMYNGGTPSTLSGAAATLSSRFRPPLLGAQDSIMLLWQSDNNKEREIYYKCFQTGSPAPESKKGSTKRTFSFEFAAQLPDPAVAPVPFDYFYAGALS